MKRNVKKSLKHIDRYAFVAAIVMTVVSAILLLSAYAIRYGESGYYEGVPLGQAIRQGSAEVTLDSVEYKTGSKSFQAPKNMKYLVATMTVTNVSDRPIFVAPSSDMYVKTSAGDVSYLSPVALDHPFKSGEILPGEKTKGELSFAVNPELQQKLYVESDWSGGTVSYTLQTDNGGDKQ